ncbi:HxlR family transcriptional regulator [Catellatospora sp. TT07R-123]|uniref:winged helix-turn-helix transcriptional regulator n=1 Tax=Catellatospora sp. TT07R-123 TaxID=2733863 RepID=UPI001B02F62C|nr:helix-turn-helix domain-containing protein [Catellatospora sp. TT07R-123]GHJ49939.1 HxlR family transcriptional regulator [Catellatospora sp. TT07R-123]
MAKRLYGQLCPVARSLDVLGERWTLLIVRELLLGPHRFKELLAVLPAMGTNRLSERLQALEQAGVVVRRPVPGAAELRAYELTPAGEALRPILMQLAAWGSTLPADDDADPGTARADLIALYLAGTRPAAPVGPPATWQLRVGGQTFHVRAEGTEVRVRTGTAPTPTDADVETDLPTFQQLVTGDLAVAEALARGSVDLRGDRQDLHRLIALLHRPAPNGTP